MKKIQIKHTIDLDGTLIDFETTHWDVKLGEIITAGFLSGEGFIICQRLDFTEEKFKKILNLEIQNHSRPWYAFNKEFEESFLGFSIDKELQQHERESAFGALLNEGLLDHYNSLGDPCFNDEISNFWDAYKLRKDPVFLSKIVRHNYCCLAKEYYLYLKRENKLDLSKINRLPTSAQIEKEFIRKQLNIK